MDTRTAKNIESLHPNARDWAKAFLLAVDAADVLPPGHTVRIISGNRTWAEQDELYAQGRTKNPNLPTVTNARGGQSNHNFGIAFDVGVFKGEKYLGASPLYAALGPIGEGIGLEWGGHWKSRIDQPHYQVKTGLKPSDLRALMLRGKPLPVPEYGGSAQPPPSDDVEVYDNAEKTAIEAFFHDGRVWVGLRKFVDRFGGEVLQTNGNNFVVQIDDERISIEGTLRDGSGFAKFADLNRVLGWGYVYEGRRLTILTGGQL